jgi:hypothetical protein
MNAKILAVAWRVGDELNPDDGFGGHRFALSAKDHDQALMRAFVHSPADGARGGAVI